ncbi:MAG TPA: protease inhibitor I42 family protein [Meiothermus sp.]|nr:protease inhibitor I42 family protein [Meiothermus sp.]
MRLKLNSLLIGFLLALAGCVPATTGPAPAQPNPDPKTLRLSEKDAGQIVYLGIGDTLVIALESNLSTGFRWVLPAFIDGFLLEAQGEDYLAAKPGVIGGGGRQIFRYRAVRTGQTLLQFEYLSPARQVQRTAIYTVVVR